jgi:formimidoylglutamate deiminase
MLKAGYTSVAEFHYLHRRRDGTAYAGGNALWQAIELAADDAGIGLTLLPVLYQSSDFGGRPLKREQARFAMEADVFLRRIDEALAEQRRAGRSTRRTGAAFHSLRAVPLDIVQATTRQLHDIDASLPIHIHIAEQLLEVQACKRETGRRPVELLLETGLVTPRWCLVHATHCTPAELRGIAETSAAVCVSISTEANLGDGFFDTARFLQAGGRLCVGSDSQSTVSPAEELRWLEYQQRLRKKRRVVLTTRKESHAGTRLWAETAECGARAIGQAAGAIAVGRRADWVVLDSEHPSMAGAAVETTLDHLLFAAAATAIRDVMVAGRWVVRGGRHPVEGRLAAPFAALMQRLALDSAPEPP